MNPYEVNEDFPFDQLSLNSPNAMQGGGAYFTKITVDTNPLYVQLPRSSSKNGIVTTKRSHYIDLTYDLNNCSVVKSWLDSLEVKCKDMIDEKKALWFSGDVNRSDIESMMADTYREINSIGVLAIRCKIDTSRRTNNIKCKIYNEDETEITDLSVIDKDSVIIPLVAVEGMKFTGRSIDLEFKIVQIMVLDKEEVKDNACLIKRKNKQLSKDSSGDVVKIDMAALRESNKASNNPDESDSSTTSNKSTSSDKATSTEPATDKGELQEVQLDVENVSANSDEEDDDDSASATTNTSQATSIAAPEGLEEITLSLEEDDKSPDVKGDVTLGSLTDLPDELVENAKKEVVEGIQEIQLEATDEEAIKLKQPQEVYIEIYRAAKAKAKKLKQAAMEAYLEVKQIKTNYMLDNLDESDDEDFSISK